MTTENDDLRDIKNTIDFGFEAEAFLQSKLGRYLIGRAEAEVEEAVERLKRVDPENASQIRAIQQTINVAESFQYWLGEAVQAGITAQSEFIEQGS